MIVAVRAPDGSEDKFWVAEVTNSKKLATIIQYNLKYYLFDKESATWKLGRGNKNTGTCKHSAIVFAGITFTKQKKIPTAILRHINKNLEN